MSFIKDSPVHAIYSSVSKCIFNSEMSWQEIFKFIASFSMFYYFFISGLIDILGAQTAVVYSDVWEFAISR